MLYFILSLFKMVVEWQLIPFSTYIFARPVQLSYSKLKTWICVEVAFSKSPYVGKDS